MPPNAETRWPHATAPAAAQGADTAPRLAGDLAIWFVILLELLTFGIMFVAYAFARLRELALFNATQATLELWSGTVNTVLLISGSWCVARAVQTLRDAAADASRHAARWTTAAVACGVGFLLLKFSELAGKFAAGMDLDGNRFWMFYVLLTGFHFLHVLVATLALIVVGVWMRRGAYGPGRGADRLHTPETVAAFWHMVDLLWIVLFPLLYVMR